MKKVFKLSLLILSFLFILTACGNKEVEEETTGENTTQKPAVSETTSEETSTTTEALALAWELRNLELVKTPEEPVK